MAEPDIDGALVGGASLDPDEFARIVQYTLSRSRDAPTADTRSHASRRERVTSCSQPWTVRRSGMVSALRRTGEDSEGWVVDPVATFASTSPLPLWAR